MSHKSIARILLGCIELDDGKETLQLQLSERRQKIILKKLDAWCANGEYRDTILNMVTLSRSLDIPKPELSKYFSGLNTTFRFWLAEVRFEAAKKMILEKPNYSNDMISAECGFSSRSNLYRMFKEKEGCSPTAWREKNCQRMYKRCPFAHQMDTYFVATGHLVGATGHLVSKKNTIFAP